MQRTTFFRSLLSLAVAIGVSNIALSANVPKGTLLAEKQEIIVNNGAEPQSLDPHKVEGVPESQIIYQLFEGLVSVDSDGNEQPGIAERWEHSPDFKTWTFYLRPNVKWSNGDPVTASDFVYAWQRLVNPMTASPYASFLTYLQVENAQDIIEGKKKPEELGVKAVDDHTFVVQLINSVPYAPSLTSHQTLVPLNRKVVEKHGEQWVRVENFVGNGAYTLTNHVLNEKIEFKRNSNYWNDKETVIDKATFLAIASPTTDVARYRAGEVDVTNYGLPPEQFPKLKKEMPNEVFTPRTLSTYMYEINHTKKPFDDIRVRKALNYLLDRNIITDKVLGQGQTPTYVFTPPYIQDGQKIQQPEYAKLPMKDRQEQAIQWLKELGYTKQKPLEFTLLYNTNENHKKVAIAVGSMWKTNSQGLIDIKLENQEWKSYLDTRRNAKYDVARAGWAADYNQASTFANYFLSTSSNNTSFYKSAEYDKAIEASLKAENAEQRAEAYAKAEEILANDVALIPLYSYVNTRLVKPYVKGYEGKDPQDNILLKNLYIIKH